MCEAPFSVRSIKIKYKNLNVVIKHNVKRWVAIHQFLKDSPISSSISKRIKINKVKFSNRIKTEA